MNAICEYVNRSAPTVLNWVYQLGFPATKLGGQWESETDLIDDWRKKQAAKGAQKPPNVVKKEYLPPEKVVNQESTKSGVKRKNTRSAKRY